MAEQEPATPEPVEPLEPSADATESPVEASSAAVVDSAPDTEVASSATASSTPAAAATSGATTGIELPELVLDPGEGASLPLGALDGVGLELSAVIGRRHLQLRELLRVRAGTVIELESLQGDPVELVVDGRCIARAEVVVIDGKIGARILALGEHGSS